MISNNHILVVDDNYGIRRLMFEFLTQEGFEVREASDGTMALDLVQEKKPALVLLDMRMPGLSGMQTLARLKEVAPETIVVIMSAYFDALDLKNAVREGRIKQFIIKPFDLLEMRILLKRLMSARINEYQNIIS